MSILVKRKNDFQDNEIKKKHATNNNMSRRLMSWLINSNNFQALCGDIEKHSQYFDEKHVVTALNGLHTHYKKSSKRIVIQNFSKPISILKNKIEENILQFDSRNFADIVNHLEFLGINDKALFEKITRAAAENITNRTTYHDIVPLRNAYKLAQIEDKQLFHKIEAYLKDAPLGCNNFQITSWTKNTSDFVDCMREIELYVDRFDGIGLSCAFVTLARHFKGKTISSEDALTINKLKQKIFSLDLNPESILHIVQSLGKLQQGSDKLTYQKLAKQAVNKKSEFVSDAIPYLLSAFKRSNFPKDTLLKEFLPVIKKCLPMYTGNDLNFIASLYVSYGDEELFSKIADCILDTDPELSYEDLSYLTWAFGEQKNVHKKMMGFLFEKITPRAHNFYPEELHNIVGGLAKAEYFDWQLFQSLTEACSKNIENFDGKQLHFLLRSYNKLSIQDTRFYELVVQKLANKVNGLSEREKSSLCRTLSAVADNQHIDCKSLFDQIRIASQDQMQNLSVDDLIERAWAFSQAGYQYGVFFNKLSIQLKNQNLSEKQELILVAAFSNLKRPITHSFNWKNYSAVGLAQLAFHLSVISSKNDGLYKEDIEKLLNGLILQNPNLSKESAMQIHLAALYLKPVSYKGSLLESNVMVQIKRIEQPSSSKHHEHFNSILKKLTKKSYEKEYYCDGYWIDTAFVDERICFEIQGEFHYLSDHTLKGVSFFKNYLLEKSGWKIINVPVKNLSNRAQEEKVEYIKNLLSKYNIPLA